MKKFNLNLFIAGVVVVLLSYFTIDSIKIQAWFDVFRNLEIMILIVFVAFSNKAQKHISMVLYAFIGVHFTAMLIYSFLTKDQVSLTTALAVLAGVAVYVLMARRKKKNT